MQIYDAVISGAGPAGCSAALYLAREGRRVLLLEKAQFPREKVCGDGITSVSSALLEKIGVMEVVRQRIKQPTAFKGVSIYSPSGAVVNGKFSQVGCSASAAYFIPRKILDDCIISIVREHPSITFLENTSVNDLVMQGDKASSVMLLFVAELHQILCEIRQNLSGAHPHDRLGAHRSATHHQYSVIQRPVYQKGKRAGLSTRPFLTGQE